MGTIAKLGNATVSMLDDQKVVLHSQPQDANGNPTALPTGGQISYAIDGAGLATIDPTQDPTTLSVVVVGVKKAAGLPGSTVVTATFKNADGTVATGTGTVNLTQDPNELDVNSLGMSFDAPTAQ